MSAPDVTSSEFKANAHRIYANWRRHSPVKPTTLPDGQTIWLVTRYDDVASVLKDDRLFKDKRKLTTRQGLTRILRWFPTLEALERNMLDVDAPDHRRLRSLVHKVFTPRRVEEMSLRIELLADRLLFEAHRRGSMELIADYALPIPTTIISDMLGIPEEDRHRFHGWSTAIVGASASSSVWKLLPGMFRFVRYLRRVIARKRDEPEDDLIYALVKAEENDEVLSSDEVLAMVLLLVVAGHETTVNLIGNGALALLQNPNELERLRAEPALYPSAVEEILRFYSPVEVATERYPAEPIELRGTTIPRHALVGAVLASANRDDSWFAVPDALDIGRTPNPHLAFGNGAHFCLGAPLARLEGRIALQRLFESPSRLELDRSQKTRWRRGLNLRGLETLPVEFGPSRARSPERSRTAGARASLDERG